MLTQLSIAGSIGRLLIVALLTALSGLPQLVKAETNDPLFETIDLSPGKDIYHPDELALNRTTHKLYIAGRYGVKVIDTATQAVLDSIYSSDPDVQVVALGTDESPAPAGNKIYVARLNSISGVTILHVVDGETNARVTAGGSDLLLPGGYSSMVVNPINHKVYLARDSGAVAVVDGPGQQLLKNLTTNSGELLVVNPVANKVFVLGRNGGAIIDSTTDTVTPLSLGLLGAADAVFNPGNGRIYLAAVLQDRFGIFVLDGTTGALLDEKTDLPHLPRALSIAPETNTIYASDADTLTIAAYDAADLGFKTSFPARALNMVYDAAGGGSIFFLERHEDPVFLRNSVGILHPANGDISTVPIGYLPCEIAINSKTNRFYVADWAAPEVLVMDGESHEIVGRAPAGPSNTKLGLFPPPGDIAVSEKLNRFYFPRHWRNSSIVDVYDGATNLLRNSILVDENFGASRGAVEVDDNRGLIYVSATRSEGSAAVRHFIFVYDAQTEVLKKTITLGLGGSAGSISENVPWMALNPVTGQIFFPPAQGDTIVIIDGNSHTQTGSVTVGDFTALAVNSQSNKIFVAVGTSAPNSPVRILVIDGATGLVETSFAPPQFGGPTLALAVDPASNILYAGYPRIAPGKVAAFDAANNYRFIGAVEAGPVWRLAFNSATNELLTANISDGAIGVLRPERWKLFANISTRGRVGPSSENVLIGGFIVDGPPGSTKKVVVRALGPSLTDFGVANALPDTTIELHDSLGNVIRNDDWKLNELTNTSQEAEIVATGIPPRSDAESAIIAVLPPGPCTAVVRGKNGDAGVALIEVYVVDQAPHARLANISTRGSVGKADDALIGGLIVHGLQPSRVVMRAIGPTLADFGVADPLQDPALELRDSNGSLVEFNDDWKREAATGTSQEADIVATSIPPTDDRESAIVVTLQPGQYTAVVRGKADTTGVALVEAYNID